MKTTLLFNLLIQNISSLLTTPIGLIYAAVLTGQWRFSPRRCKTLLCTYAFLLIPMDVLIWYAAGYSYSSQLMVQLFNIISGGILIAILQAYPFSSYLFIMLTVFDFLFISHVLKRLFHYLWGIPYLSTNIVSGAVIAFILYWFFSKKIDYLIGTLRISWWKLDIFPLLLFLFYYLLCMPNGGLTANPSYYPVAVLMCVMTCCFYILLHTLFHTSISVHQEEMFSHALLQQLRSMDMQISNFNEVNNNIKTLRHDLRHYIAVISGCLKNRDIEQAQKVVDSLEKNIGKIWEGTSRYIYTGEPILDSILSYHRQQAEAVNISFTVNLLLPSHLPVPATDLAILLSNALENAINACTDIPEGMPRFVTVNHRLAGAQFFLELANSYIHPVIFNSRTGLPDNPITGHGFGCKSIQAIAERNGAYLNYSTTGHIFRLHVLFPLEEAGISVSS